MLENDRILSKNSSEHNSSFQYLRNNSLCSTIHDSFYMFHGDLRFHIAKNDKDI